jgi:hypothetical protein
LFATGLHPTAWTAADLAKADAAAADVIRVVKAGAVEFDPRTRKDHLTAPTASLVGALELFGDAGADVPSARDEEDLP